MWKITLSNGGFTVACVNLMVFQRGWRKQQIKSMTTRHLNISFVVVVFPMEYQPKVVPPPAYWILHFFFLLGGKYGNKLLFASVAINTTMVLSKTGQTEGLKVYEHWEHFVKQKVWLAQVIHTELLEWWPFLLIHTSISDVLNNYKA